MAVVSIDRDFDTKSRGRIMIAQHALMKFVIELAQFRGSSQPGLRSQQARCHSAGDAREERTAMESMPAAPVQKLAPGPWRSLGGYLNYAEWAERERFLELDAALLRTRVLGQAEDRARDERFAAESETACSAH